MGDEAKEGHVGDEISRLSRVTRSSRVTRVSRVTWVTRVPSHTHCHRNPATPHVN